MSTLTETTHAGGFILSLANRNRSLENATLASGNNLTAGAVLGLVAAALEASSAAKAGGNTGDGTFVLDATTPVLPSAIAGVYTLRCIEAAANGGVFRLEDPNGFVLGDVTITGGAGGTAAVNEQIKGVITDGATDFAVGDGFDITVVADDDATNIGHYAEYDPAATNGAQTAVAVLYDGVDATSAAKDCVIVARDAEVNQHELIWKTGLTDNQKATAGTQLKDQGILVR